MRKRLIESLSRHAGATLTAEVARSVLDELFPLAAHAPAAFGWQDYKGYRFQAERFGEVLPELHPLHEQHYQETDKHRAGLALNPDYDSLIERERNGGLIQFTARTEAGELVANMRVIIGRSSHTQTLFCEEDTFYVVPAHRGGFMAVRLWQFVENAVRSIGVREIRFNSRLANRADQMARYLKYTPVAMQFVKIFD
jgi:hypothetical protein